MAVTDAVDVVVDASALWGAGSFRGIASYVRGLLGGLAKQEDLRVTALCPVGAELPSGIRSVRIRRHAPGRLRPLENALLLPIDYRRAQGDVAHGTSIHPPAVAPRPFVQTLLDVIPVTSDDPALAGERRRWKRSAPRYRRAQMVVAISRHAADEGIRHLGLDPARVEVAYPGLDPRFGPEGDLHRHDTPYVLLVAEYSRRKGFEDAFTAIAAVAGAGLPHRLVVAGRVAPWVRPQLDAAVTAAPRPELVDVMGFVEDLPALYRGADLVIVPSRAEGFGLPALEAMGCGIPVVAYDNTSLPEVLGGAGVLVPDGDRQELGRQMVDLLRSAERRDQLRQSGLDRASGFTWGRNATIHAAVYHHLAPR